MAASASNKEESPFNDSSSSEREKMVKHWFYEHKVNGKLQWTPFTYNDSLALDEAVESHDPHRNIITTDGGRFDVDIPARTRSPVYWKGDVSEVRRCSWFYKVDSKFIPYDEGIADLLEHEYQEALLTNDWHRRIELPNSEQVVFHDANVIVHFQQKPTVEEGASWAPQTSPISKPRVVKRGIDEFTIEDGDCDKIDHLLFMVHGIGSVCDLKLRTVEEVVDEFRSISQQLIQSHYRSAYDEGKVGRVEVLPVSWWNSLHSDESGIDQQLKSITLESIPKLRSFTNETLLDVLFYTSPVFSQNIIDTVTNALNRKYSMFLKRNRNFKGKVSLAGHSLGSLILFDMLCNQKPVVTSTPSSKETSEELHPVKRLPLHRPLERSKSKQIDYRVGVSGTGQPFMNYPQLTFEPKNFFALGSPIGMFVTIRGVDLLGIDFRLPTCEGFFNIFHPYDPVAYRLEGLVNPELAHIPPSLIPHHKGRKRMHLELKETMNRVSTDIREKVMSSFKSVTETVCALNPLLKNMNQKAIEKEANEILDSQIHAERASTSHATPPASPTTLRAQEATSKLAFGKLNQSKRLDYVLQEAPLEFFNEYLFALTAHVCYWESPDTILFIVKEIYDSLGIEADKEVPNMLTLKIERPVPSDAASSTETG